MILFGKNLNLEVAIVAEIGVNHEGSVDKALELVELAAESGADAVKFQTYSPERFVSSSDPDRLIRVSQFALSAEDFRRLAAAAKEHGVEFFSAPITEDVVDQLNDLCGVFKIASGDLTFEPVIRAVCRTGKPLILSTGLGTVAEIDQAVDWISEEVGQAHLSERLVLMHCVSAYPTPIEEANVMSVPFLAHRYGVTVGYSNHVLGLEASLAALAHGASVIEVHFTDRKTDREFRDHELSMEAHELAQLVEMAPRICASLGQFGKVRQPSELPMLDLVRKGIVASRNLSAGSVLGTNDVMYARPAIEFSASEIDKVTGSTLSVDLKYGELIPRSGINFKD
jgi:N,N'-diacetyllegionaminate synthase